MTSGALAAINALVERFYALFANASGREPDLSEIRRLCIPECLIIKAQNGSIESYDLDRFIEPRRKILTDGSLVDFEEWETESQTEIFDTIAQRISHYAKRGSANGEAFTARGVKTMQFVKTNDEWRFSSVSWFDYS